MTDLEKLEYIHATLQDMEHIFGVEDDMLTRSIKHVEELTRGQDKEGHPPQDI